MSPFNLLLCCLLATVSCQNTSTANPLEITNNYLRSFLPWWPKTENISLRSAPIVDLLSPTSNSTDLDDDVSAENGTAIEDDIAPVDPEILRVQDIPQSPLDDFSPDTAPRGIANNHDGNFIINFDEMGECPRDCSADLQEAMSIVLQEMSHIERYERICGKYKGAQTCVNEDERCDDGDRGMFEMMTSGLHYMCVEQELAFNATIECIDREAGLVQSECENQCQTKNLFMNWILKGAMQNTIQQGVNGIVGAATGTNANPLDFLQGMGTGGQTGWADMLGNIGKPPTPESAQQGFENFRQFTNDLCRIGDCMLDCIRSKFNTRCEGSAGTLLSEVFVRPIAASQNKLSILRPVMGMFMPDECAYLHNNADLQKHRIGATMDEELKRMYAEKAAKEIRERNEQDELLSNLVPLDHNGVPLPRALPDIQQIESPLDVSVKTLDQLILEMYSKNDSKSLNISEKNNVTATFLEEKETNTTATTTMTEKSATQESTTTTTEIAVTSEAVVTNRSMEYSEDQKEASGAESSGEDSGESPEETSEASGSSAEGAEASGAEESSGTTLRESSGDEESSGEASGTQESSGEMSGEPSEVKESSGIETDDEASGSGIQESSGYSDDVTLYSM